jgi:branched-chain amino acid aminotransferase
MNVNVDRKIVEALGKYNLPENLGFGQYMAPVMAYCDYENGAWGDLFVLPYGPISIYPTAKVLHYGQEIFEGLKAYKVKGEGPFVFRPEENHLRFNRSAERMARPHIPKEIFMEACEEVVAYCSDIIPRRSGESLYLRPFMYGADETLGIRPSEKYRFMVIASPSASYFAEGSTLSVLIERHSSRAFPGGTGFAKTGGNYAASLLSAIKAKNLGLSQTLWLDGKEKEYLEEMSGMNVFAVIDGHLHTPELNDSILEGITRKSIITISADLGLEVVERKISITELLEQIKTGVCTECFACGTAAIITPINYFAEESGERYPLSKPEGPVAMKIREALLGIQEGRAVDKYKWIKKI